MSRPSGRARSTGTTTEPHRASDPPAMQRRIASPEMSRVGMSGVGDAAVGGGALPHEAASSRPASSDPRTRIS
jgi:hypothetical protein